VRGFLQGLKSLCEDLKKRTSGVKAPLKWKRNGTTEVVPSRRTVVLTQTLKPGWGMLYGGAEAPAS